MTRLRNEDINSITGKLQDFDRKLISITGHNLRDLAILASGLNISEEVQKKIGATLVGVVPFSSGKGIIEDFSKTLVSIACHIGFKSFVTKNTDIKGFTEAVELNCDILIMADDDAFIAYNCKTGRLSDNNPATAEGFVAGLEMMTGGLFGKTTLVLGAGPVGRFAVKGLLKKGSSVALFDINLSEAEKLQNEFEQNFPGRLSIEKDLKTALSRHSYIFDATPAKDIIDAGDISSKTYITAPGVPCGLTDKAVEKIGSRLLHDNLSMGTAVMLIKALFSKDLKISN